MAKKREKESKLAKEVKKIKKEEKKIEATQRKILKEIEEKKLNEKAIRLEKAGKFTIADFGKAVIGAVLFSGFALFNSSFWQFLSEMPDSITYKVILAHLFFLAAVVITLNYSLRGSFRFDLNDLKKLLKRASCIYLAVLVTILILLWSFNRINAEMSVLELIRLVIIGDSLGLVGAVTFSFLLEKS